MNPRLEWKLVLLGVGLLGVVVNLFLTQGERRRGIAFVLAWLVPGAGHVLLGRWKKGLSLFAMLAATYVFGLWIVGFRTVSFDDNPFYYVGQYGSGATFLLARLLGEKKAYPLPDMQPSWFDPGLLYVCVVGLLNLVVMMNVLDLKAAGVPVKPAEAVPPATPAPSVPAPEKSA